ncbi:MAG: hypothetical protein KYX62_11725 [Pseudomonadota bacterium]|nr:hypothetical protein [Pseudomonadota bacterium]
MRNLLIWILTVFALPAVADMAADFEAELKAGKTVEAVYAEASEACGGNCDADIIEALYEAGITKETIALIALNRGVDVATIMSSLEAAGVSVADAGAAIQGAAQALGLNPETVQDAILAYTTDPDTNQAPAAGPLPAVALPTPTAPTPTGGGVSDPDEVSPAAG